MLSLGLAVMGSWGKLNDVICLTAPPNGTAPPYGTAQIQISFKPHFSALYYDYERAAEVFKSV